MFVLDTLIAAGMFALWSFGIAFLLIGVGDPIIAVGMIILSVVIFFKRFFPRSKLGMGMKQSYQSPFDDPNYLNK